MKEFSMENWIESLIFSTPNFVKSLENKEIKGSFNLTKNGSTSTSKKFGLGFTAFAIRVFKICKCLDEKDYVLMKKYILNFKTNENYFFDKYIARKTFLVRFLRTIKNRDLRFIANTYTKLAETRQTLAALLNLDVDIKCFMPSDFLNIDIQNFLSSLNWNKPWASSSYLNHLLFMNNYLVKDDSKRNFNNEIILSFLKDKQNKNGLFGNINVSNTKQVTGSSMKLLMALSIINQESIIINNTLIDNLLIKSECFNACEEVNLAFSLCSCLSASNYRSKEIKKFLLEMLGRWQKVYFYEKLGGFSFYHKKSQYLYYDLIVGKGFDAPDIHGTAMFLMGIERILKSINHPKSILFSSCYL